MARAKICFLVGSMAISGGTYVIVQHAAHLHRAGFDVTLAVQEQFTAQTLAWHDEICNLRCVPIEQARQSVFELVIATWWKTAYELHSFRASRYGYFVQSIESRFYPEAEVPLRNLVDTTYALQLACVTEASWIQAHLRREFAQEAVLVRNGIRKDIYRPDGVQAMSRPSSANPPRVLVEGHFGVPFKNTALSLRLVKEAGLRDIWVLTGSPVRWLPGVNRLFSRVPVASTPPIYRSCDILVKLSTVEGMFGPPLEMFHCGGTSVVFDVSGHDEYIVEGQNAIVVHRGDMDGVVTKLRELAAHPDALIHLKQGALATAQAWPSWEESSKDFMAWVDGCLNHIPVVDQEALATMTRQAYADYGAAERERHAANPGIVRRHKVSAAIGKLPAGWVAKAKQLEAIGEVLLGPRKVR